MIVNKRITLLFIVICLSYNFFAQVIPEVPELINVSIDRKSKMVEISWTMKEPEKVDGYIIKRQIFGQPNVVDGSFNTVATIDNNKQLKYIDSLDSYGYAMPNSRVETYRVVSYKNINSGKVIYSNMSKALSTIYLSTVEFDLCAKKNKLVWTAYNGFGINLKSYRIYYSNSLSGSPVYVGEVNDSDTSFVHTDVESDKRYYYHVEAVGNNDLVSLSNMQYVDTGGLVDAGVMNADYASVIKKGNIEVSFTLDKDAKIKSYVLLKSISKAGKYDTIASFLSGLESIKYVDTLKTNKQIVYYKLTAINECGDIAAESNIANNILLKARASTNDKFINNLSWNEYENWLGGVGFYVIYRKYDNTIFEKIAELPFSTNTYKDNILNFINKNRNGVSSSGKFCYYVEAVEGIGNPHGITGKSKSNISCTYQEAVVYFPNAINPKSNIAENRTFRPITMFVSDYQLIIYDRLGGIVFKSNDPLQAWDGRKNGGNLLMKGTYVFFLQYRSKSKNLVKTSGEINLIY